MERKLNRLLSRILLLCVFNNRFILAFLPLFIVMPFASQAGPVTDLSQWKISVVSAFSRNDVDKIAESLDQVRDLHFDPQSAVAIFKQVQTQLQGNNVIYASIIQDQSLGNLFRNISVGVRYQHQIICYSILFAGSDNGWSAANFSVDGNINKCLNTQWPQFEK